MLDLKEEQKYEQLRKLAQELHIPIPEVFLELEVTDKNGKVIQKHKQRSHSWTRNAYNLLFSELAGKDANDTIFGAGKLNIKDTDGITQAGNMPIELTYNQSVDGTGNGYRALAGDNSYGIVVGSGTNVESFEDYALQTLIANGTGAGQLSYILSELHSISYAALVLSNTLVRYFNNNSGGSISVNEVGLVVHGLVSTAGK